MHAISLFTNKPVTTLADIAQAKDLDNPNKINPVIVDSNPISTTGLRPIRSESEPHGIPNYELLLDMMVYGLLTKNRKFVDPSFLLSKK